MRRSGRGGIVRRAVAASLAMSMALCGLAPATAALADELAPQADDQVVSGEVVDTIEDAESGENDQLPGDVNDAEAVSAGETVDGEGDATDLVPSDPQDPEPSDPSVPTPDVPSDTEPSVPTDPTPETPVPGEEGGEVPADPEESDEEGETPEEVDELDDAGKDEEAEARAKAEAAADLAAEHRGDLADGTYALRVSNSSSAVLDVQGASSAPGAKVNLWSRKSTGDNQLWSVTHDDDGFVKLTNISSGLVLGVSTVSQGSRTMQLEDSGEPAQRWIAVKDGSSFKLVSAADTSLVLDARHASTANGTWVELYADNGTSNQRWVAVKTATLRESLDALASNNVSGAILAPGSYAIEPAHATKLALDVQGGSISSGAKVNLWSYGGRSNQVWNVSLDSKGYVSISNLKSGLVLDASGSSMRQATPDESSWYQKWIVVRDGLGIKLVSAVDGTRVLDVRRAGSTNGTETILYSDTGAANQRWRFVGANANRALINDLANTRKGDLKDGTYYIRLEGSDGAVLDVQGGSMSNSAKVNLWGKKVSANQAWTVTHDSQGYVTLTNYGSGKVLDVQGGPASNGARLIQYTSNGGWNQKWIAIKDGSSYKLVSAMDPGFVLNAHEGSSTNGTWTEIMPESNGAGQSWAFEWFNISQLLSERQLRLIEAAKSTPSPGPGLCAAWVTNAFINAGVGYFWGDACDMYDDWCHTSVSFIKPGMIIAVDKSPTPAGRIWGHVGIYIGDGKVMHSTGDYGQVQTWTLEEWLDTYDELATPKCGWMGGLDLSR